LKSELFLDTPKQLPICHYQKDIGLY